MTGDAASTLTDRNAAGIPGGAVDSTGPAHSDADAMPLYERKTGSGIRSLGASLLTWLITRKWLHWLLRTLCPILHIPGWATLVTRYDHVAEVLSRHDVFTVPWHNEISRLNDGEEPGTPFILGTDDRDGHDLQTARVMNAFRRSDVETFVKPQSRAAAEQIVAACGGRLDAIQGLITRVPLELCQTYYGVHIPGDRQKFADAAIDVSAHLFGPPPKNEEYTNEADAAANYVRWVVDRAMEREYETPSGAGTVLARLSVARRNGLMKQPEIRAFLMGMIIGFVPTNTIAGGHILEMLLRKPAFMAKARAAAQAGDDDLLTRCLFEASRFMPINPGPFRMCKRDFVLGAGTRRSAMIKKNTTVFAMTMSAMFDSREVKAPFAFNPGRPASDYMLFGHGLHFCAGVFIAKAQTTQTLKALLLQEGLQRAPGREGALRVRGDCPDRLFVEFRRAPVHP